MKFQFPISPLSTLSIAGIFLANLPSSLFHVNALPAPQPDSTAPPLGYVKLPAPTGPYVVGTTNLILTDHNRLETLSPTPNTTARTFFAQVFYPTLPLKKLNKAGSTQYNLSPYLTPGLAQYTEAAFQLAPGTFGGVTTNSYVDAPVVLPRGEAKEVVIFSPGYGASRSYYTTFHENLASLGFIVIAIEHLYDTEFVDIPGLGEFRNTFSNTSVPIEEQITPMHNVRVGDSLFILKSLANKTSELVKGIEVLLEDFDTRKKSKEKQKSWWSKNSKVAMYGHSLGGSTSLATILANKTPTKLQGGINLDGTFWSPIGNIPSPPPAEYKTKEPFLIWGAPGQDREMDESWSAVYNHILKGWKRELSLEGAKHGTFTDLPALVDLFGMRSLVPKELVDEVVGTIPGVRSLVVIREVVAEFFEYALRGDKGSRKLLDGAGQERWPEVIFKW